MFQEYCREHNVKYDVVIRNRADLIFHHIINVEKTLKQNGDNVHLFGGWDPRGALSEAGYKEYLFDGFAYATPENINLYCDLYLKENPYEHIMINLEAQLREYLIQNNFELNYIGESKRKDSRWYKIVR